MSLTRSVVRLRMDVSSRVKRPITMAPRVLPLVRRRRNCPEPLGGMIRSMRVKTSVTIDERVLKAIDKATTRNRSRSRVIEDAAREFLARRARAAREARDLAILNESAAALNQEMEDVLTYQADV